MKQRKRVPRAEREQQMMDAAVAVFARDGFHAAGMEEIAVRCGVSKPMLYLYFESKEGLFIACIKRESERLATRISEAVSGHEEPKDQLWNGLRAFLEFVDANRGAWSVLYRRARYLGDPVSTEVSHLRENMIGLVTSLLSHGEETEGTDISVAAHTLVGACESLSDWLIDRPEISVDEIGDQFTAIMWPGLAHLFRADREEAPRKAS
ncbi:TetR/AcrR family transcriptional regulator [Salininema proteolyticum]|uniref:TetR/AcrR family transcriptional regulator n=1 Tax=Salininema proteolyticum TaxID=1607685 RepID=A0ABV8U1S3_9ACTN